MKKFFDIDAPASGTTSSPTQTSLGAMLAQHGVVNNTPEPIAQAVNIPSEKKDTPPAQEPTPVATTTATPSAEQANPESPAPATTTETPTAQPPIAEASKPVSWQEVLKSQQPDAVMQELGYSDNLVKLLNTIKDNPQMQAFFNHWAANGDTNAYLREANTDYKVMPAEEVMRHQLRKEYPKASSAQLDVLYKKEVIEAYNLDSEDPAELEQGKLLLEAKADRYRDDFVSNQQNFLLPKAPEPKAAGPDPLVVAQQEEAKKAVEKYRSQMDSDPYVKNVLSNNKVTLGEGAEAFNYNVDPKKLFDYLYNEQAVIDNHFEIEKNPDGSVKDFKAKAEHQMLVAAVGVYGKAFLNEYAKHLLSLGGQKAIAPIENASGQSSTPSATEVKPTSPAAAMATQGVLR